MSDLSDLNIEYLQLVTRHQSSIYGYIRSIAPGVDAEDVLQEANIVLWEKASTFKPGSNFKAFALRVAHFKALEALRARKREHWLKFDSDIMEDVVCHYAEQVWDHPSRENHLLGCLAELNEETRQLIHQRYYERQTVRKIAKDHNKTEGSMQQAFFRIRKALLSCIERKQEAEGGPA